MSKVKFSDKKLAGRWLDVVLVISTVAGFALALVPCEGSDLRTIKIIVAAFTIIGVSGAYIASYFRARNMRSKVLRINNTEIEIRQGDIFNCEGVAVIAFNEYFDTLVDEMIISSSSLNGQYLRRYWPDGAEELDALISADERLLSAVEGVNDRPTPGGKRISYRLGTSFRHGDFILTAMTKFDENNAARTSFSNHLVFLSNMWVEVANKAGGKDVYLPVLGSGITRFDDSGPLTYEELIDLILLSFKHCGATWPNCAKITIVLTEKAFEKLDMYHLGDCYAD